MAIATNGRFYTDRICYDGIDINTFYYDLVDHCYEYTVTGKIPNGITYSQDYGCLLFHGTPGEKGSFVIIVSINVEVCTYDCDVICENTVSRGYIINVK